MPPALRNQRAPTAGDTPAPTAASSVEHPAAIAAQNSWRSSRRATEGRPGNGKAPRPDRSERCFRMAIATSSLKVLRRPLEPKQAAIALMMGDPNAIPDRLLAAVVKLLAAVALAAGVLAAADLVWARLSWRRELRMTRHEVKEEHKE